VAQLVAVQYKLESHRCSSWCGHGGYVNDEPSSPL